MRDVCGWCRTNLQTCRTAGLCLTLVFMAWHEGPLHDPFRLALTARLPEHEAVCRLTSRDEDEMMVKKGLTLSRVSATAFPLSFFCLRRRTGGRSLSSSSSSPDPLSLDAGGVFVLSYVAPAWVALVPVAAGVPDPFTNWFRRGRGLVYRGARAGSLPSADARAFSF